MKKSFTILFVIPLVFIAFKSGAVNSKVLSEISATEIAGIRNTGVKLDSFLPIMGRWKIARFINGDMSTIPDDKTIKSLMDKTILFTWRMAVVLNDTCVTPIYDSHRYKRAEFLYKYLGQQSDIGIIGDTINVARVRCGGRTVYNGNIPANNYYYRFIVKDDQSLLMVYNGNFLLLNKVNEKAKVVAAVQKPFEVKPAEVKKIGDTKASEKPAIKAHNFKYDEGANDPFYICRDLINSAVKQAETNSK